MSENSKRITDSGFTLIEVLIVIAIIGILAAIAIPQFTSYRTRSYNSTAKSDMRTVAVAQEAYYLDNDVYTNSLSALVSNYGLVISDGVNANITGSSNAYVVTAAHTSGNETYSLDGPGGTITE